MAGLRVVITDTSAIEALTLGVKKLPKGIDKGIKRITRNIRKTAIDRMKNSTPTGRYYKIGGKMHRASAPGEPPAVLSGALIRSIQTEFGPLWGSIVTDREYGPYLEDGTSRMAARPWMEPAIALHGEEITDDLSISIQEEMP